MISCFCKSLYFHIFLTNAVVISLQKPPLCGGGADELWSNRDAILSFTSKYPQIRTIPNILIISTDSHNSKYPHIMISQDLRNIYNYPQHNQRSKEYQKAAKSKQWQKSVQRKYCQRHDTPEIWVLVTKTPAEGLGIICTLLERRCHFLVCKQCTSNASSENSVKSMQSIVVQCYLHLWWSKYQKV